MRDIERRALSNRSDYFGLSEFFGLENSGKICRRTFDNTFDWERRIAVRPIKKMKWNFDSVTLTDWPYFHTLNGCQSMNAMNSISKPMILIADSDPISLAQTIRILSRDVFNVFSAVCHASAISAAMKIELDLIVCDSTLWIGKPGHDLVAEIHDIPERADVPVIFTSAGQGPNVIRRRHDFGGAYHVKKPFDPIVFTELVEKALWMPHLIQSHIKQPHFVMNPATIAPVVSSPFVSP